MAVRRERQTSGRDQSTMSRPTSSEDRSFRLAEGNHTVQVTVRPRGRSGESACAPVAYTPNVFFRGREWAYKLPLTVDPCPDKTFFVKRSAREVDASVTLKGIDYRPIVFILDMSQSMENPKDAPRYIEAIDAIKKVIDDPRLDHETDASLIVYGHRVRNVKNKIDEKKLDADVNKKYKTIMNRKENLRNISAMEDVATEVKGNSLTKPGKTEFLRTLDNLRKLGPWGITPLVSALTTAVDGENAGRDAIIVAVTDGAASDEKMVVKLIASLRGKSHTKMVIVGFDLNAAAFTQLSAKVIDPLKAHCDISLISVTNDSDDNDTDDLLEEIRKSLSPRTYTVRGPSANTTAEKEFGEEATELRPAEDYLISFADIEIGGDTPIVLGPGDALSLKIDWAERKFVFPQELTETARNVYMSAERTGSADEQDAPLILRVAEPVRKASPRDGYNRVEVTLLLDHDERYRPVRQPAEVEFTCVLPTESDRPRNITEEFTSEWNAPGWKLTIDKWPEKKSVSINAFWKMKRTAPDDDFIYEQPIERKSAIDIGGVGFLPRAKLSIKPLDGKLQVRLDKTDVEYAPDNELEDIRVQIGTTDLRGDKNSFQPDEVTTTVIRTEKGRSVIYEFTDPAGDYTDKQLREKVIAFTSRKARLVDAYQVKGLQTSR